MCFSATASFTTAAYLSAIGIASIAAVKSKRHLLMAFIPFLFALQQASEGMVWLGMENKIPFSPYGDAAKNLFLIIAFVIWPVWIPLSLFIAENSKIRSVLLSLIAAFGICLAAFNVYHGSSQSIGVAIVGKSLRYLGELPDETYLYLFAVAVPCFISSMRWMWLFGAFVLLTAIATDFLYERMFVSVWCFFAAIVSTILYFSIRSTSNLEKVSHNF